MRKKIFSALMLGLIIAGTASTVTSCKDYDEDISGLTADNALLKSQLESLKSDLLKVSGEASSAANAASDAAAAASNAATTAALQTAIENLEKAIAEACKCESDNGLKEAVAKAQGAADAAANLAKENKEEIEKVAGELAKLHGEDLVARLGQVEAAVAAQNAALEEAGVKDFKGLLDTLNKNIADALGEVKKSQDKVKEIEDKANNLGNDIKKANENVEVITLALARDLRSLVFMPNVYMDGIETIEYPYLDTPTMKADPAYTLNREKRDGEATDKKITNIVDYRFDNGAVVFGPAWPVEYHLNPSNSKTEYADIVGFAEREAEVITRVAVGKLGITSPEKYHDGEQLFKNANGVVTVGLQIANPKLLWNNGPSALTTQNGVVESETGHASFGMENLVALQSKTKAQIEDGIVTSDYAMLAPEVVAPKAIVWSQNQPAPAHHGHTGDEVCPTCNTNVKVYDTPEEALADKKGATILLGWDNAQGVDLTKYIQTHYSKDCRYFVNGKHDKHGVWKYGEEHKWGLHYEFELVEYQIDGHQTIDSRYAYFADNFQDKGLCTSKVGVIVPGNVKAAPTGNPEDGLRIKDMDMASVGREPLVRVRLVEDASNKTVLDGYILLRITKSLPSLEITAFDEQGKGTFDLCNDLTVQTTTWSQFSKWVLTDKLEGLVKHEFEAQYDEDYFDGYFTNALGNEYCLMNLYSDMNGTLSTWKDADGVTRRLGQLTYTRNEDNTTNHAFEWSFSADEIEYLTHDKTNPVKLTQYARFIGKDGVAKYLNLWVKFTVTLDRKMLETQISEKNTNYWFKANGEDDGFEAVALNLLFPQDVTTTQKVWNNELDATFVTNKVKFTNGYNTYKYFFAPIDVTIKDQHGKNWVITSKSGASDVKWNKFVCKYNCQNGTKDSHVWGTQAANKKVLDECAIDYTAGCFTNDKLYAVAGNVYTLIAVMDQSNGNITLVRDGEHTDDGIVYGESAALDCVLNAYGYEANHAMLDDEMRTWVGVVANNGCDVAVNLFNEVDAKNSPLWIASWERPVNMEKEAREAWDAQSNGNKINLFDCFSFFDWRYQTMEGTEVVKTTAVPNDGRNGKWLWAYYNIYEIEADIKNATTDMHGANFTKKLTDVSKKVHLWAKDNAGTTISTGVLTFKIADSVAGYPDDFSQQGKSAALIAALKNAVNNDFGYLYYENNGENVEEFTVRIPVVVKYEWGHFHTSIDLKIKRTQGN